MEKETKTIESFELPSVKKLSDLTGVHFYTKVISNPTLSETDEDGNFLPVGSNLVALYGLDKRITPYVTFETLDTILLGIIAVSPLIKSVLDSTKTEE